MGLARMQGKSVVVSGAAFGIGRATAAKFAQEGASLLIQDIQERPLLAFRDELRRTGAKVEAIVGEVARIVWAAMDHRVGHQSQDGGVRRRAIEFEDACYAAHGAVSVDNI